VTVNSEPAQRRDNALQEAGSPDRGRTSLPRSGPRRSRRAGKPGEKEKTDTSAILRIN